MKHEQFIMESLELIDREMNSVWHALVEGNLSGLEGSLSDLSGTLAKFGEEGGFFNQVLEDLGSSVD